MDTDLALDALLTAWKSDIESVPLPELVSVDIALAALAIHRLVETPFREAASDSRGGAGEYAVPAPPPG
ncbi:hypothetical protein [Amycolatopsis orientalis]|uniref:hypothetical protein n=1 Tax=Amycolatopsis orientalis TaxID=31958 RepID=UPI0003A2C1F3|nr:hypothetical protein [Amycolatopsis orientalis]